MGATKMQSGALATVRTKELFAMMIHTFDDVNTCPTMGHIYCSVLSMRCPHLEAYRVVASAWYDDLEGEAVELFSITHEFGPFDSAEYVIEKMADIAAMAARVQTIHPV